MKSIEEINKYFHPQESGVVTEQEWAVLCADGRIFCTSTRLYGFEAQKIIGAHLDFREDQRTYGGYIVVGSNKTFEEAQRLADLRGWGETVDGVLIEEIPYEGKSLYHFDAN